MQVIHLFGGVIIRGIINNQFIHIGTDLLDYHVLFQNIGQVAFYGKHVSCHSPYGNNQLLILDIQ